MPLGRSVGGRFRARCMGAQVEYIAHITGGHGLKLNYG